MTIVPRVQGPGDHPRAPIPRPHPAHPPRSGSRAISPRLKLDANEAASVLVGLQRANEHAIRRAMRGRIGSAVPYTPILDGIRNGTVRYRRADPNEDWQTWRELNTQLQTGGEAFGDCEDLASAVAAEMSVGGAPSRVFVYKAAPRLFHVVIKSDRWGLLDPSRAAGMGGNG